jgi:hypothetical protein
VAVSTSQSFPLITPEDLIDYIKQAREAGDHNLVIRQFREWIRQRQK